MKFADHKVGPTTYGKDMTGNKRYQVNVHISHVVDVIATCIEEAEERAITALIDEMEYWDMLEFQILEVEDISSPVQEYLVTWSISVPAESPKDAAEQALDIQRDIWSEAVAFEVSSGPGHSEYIDLLEGKD